MKKIVTHDGTVIIGGRSRPYGQGQAESRRLPRGSSEPRELDLQGDPQDRCYRDFRELSRKLEA